MFEALIELEKRGPISQEAPCPIDNLFVDWEQEIDRWEEPGGCGSDQVSVYRAVLDAKPAFLVRKVWKSAPGYSCDGIVEDQVTFDRPERPIQSGDPVSDEIVKGILRGLGIDLTMLAKATRLYEGNFIERINTAIDYAAND